MTLEIPFLGMMLLTFFVWAFMYWRRLRYLHKNRLNPQLYASRSGAAKLPDHLQKSADNLQNLFELPVIFYALCLYLAWGNQIDAVYVLLAYLFFFGRVAHSIIHCSYNRVTHRFAAYFLSAIMLWIMVLRVLWSWFVY